MHLLLTVLRSKHMMESWHHESSQLLHLYPISSVMVSFIFHFSHTQCTCKQRTIAIQSAATTLSGLLVLVLVCSYLLVLPKSTRRDLAHPTRLAKDSLHPTPIHFESALPINQHASIDTDVRNLEGRAGGIRVRNILVALFVGLQVRSMKRQTVYFVMA